MGFDLIRDGSAVAVLARPSQDSQKFPPFPVSRLSDDDEGWGRTLRPVPLDLAASNARAIAHSRESSLEKLTQPTPPSLASPRLHTSQARSGIGGVLDKNSSYGHHRQTSIVHGIQHSRNGSLASSSSSPLSPQLIAAVGAGLLSERPDMQPDSRSLTSSLSGTTVIAPSTQMSEKALSSIDLTQRKVERMQSNKSRRDHAHQHSHSSRHQKEEQKAVGDYALHVLFTTFIARAEEKLNDCITVPFDPEPQVEQICGPGADPSFDQLIVALGHISRQKPKPLIDIMMLWRKSKSEAASEARNLLHQSRDPQHPATLQRRNTEPIQSGPSPGGPDSQSPNPNSVLANRQEFVAQAERRSTVSIYILCRVLLEVITQTSLAAITPEMEDKLEVIIFGQLKIADTEQLLASPLKLANWNLFAQLMGAMSDINFACVTDRFISDLDRTLQELSVKSPSSSAGREAEGKLELVLGGMKHLRIKTSPEESWSQSCDFFAALGRLFQRSHGQKAKSAFCQVLDMLLVSIAAKAGPAEFQHAKWAEVLNSIAPRTAQMFAKPRHWAFAFPLTATLLCVSPAEHFSSQWLQLVLPLQTKLKDRYAKPTCLQVISRILWTFLYRINEPVPNSIRKLDEVLKLVIPTTSKKVLLASDPAIAEPLIQVIRIVGYKYPEYCFKTIVFPLINGELFLSNKELKVEQLDPDRMVIGIRAFLAILADLERGEEGQPPFPQLYNLPTVTERAPPSPAPSASVQNVSSSPSLPSREENSSRPVLTSALSDGAREYYLKFCEVLGKITIICDNAFGGQAALDEKFNSPLPKTPISDTFNFSRRDDPQTLLDQKQTFYELLHVAVQALPRCLSVDIPFNSLINLLCTGTAHVQSNIAESSAQSLKAIARQSHAQQVTMGFARFIFNFDDRYSTMSEGGMLGPGHIESTLRLYVELLQIWIEEIKQKSREASADGLAAAAADRRGVMLDLSSIWAEVDHVEAHGLFFLCSQSRRVRSFAVTVLRLITEFDAALGKNKGQQKESLRFIDILENDSTQVMDFKDEHLSVAERSRLQRGMLSHNSRGALVELCSSDVSYDTTLWFKLFPNLIRIAYEKCPFAVTICRDLICGRILQLYKPIVLVSEPSSRGLYYPSDPGSARLMSSRQTTQPDVLVDQWKLYLIFACSTLADPGNPPSLGSQVSQHVRKSSRSNAVDKIVSARTLFKYLIPLLSVSSAPVRDAVVSGMGSINLRIYRTLLEELQGQVSRCNDEARARIHQRTNSNPRRNRKMDLIRTEITHVYKLTSHFLQEKDVYQDDWILGNLVAYTKDLKLFLMDEEVQMDWEFQKLRRHYCGLMEEVFEGINRTRDPSRWMTFESRKSAFSLMEDWCGFSPNHNQIRVREDTMRQLMIDQQSLGERGTVTAAMEIEKRNLRTAALSAMAALCGGPLSITNESGVTLQFDIRRMLTWIEAIFNSGSDRMNVIGRRALKNLILHNLEHSYLLEHCIARCYLADVPKVLESYFAVVTQVLLEQIDYPCPFWKLLGLCLAMLGNDRSEIRCKSSQALRALEERQQRNSKIQDYDISISDKTQAVYKLAQFEISKRLSKQYPELAFHLFSEFALFFKDLQPVSQRNVVAIMLPWIQSIELSVDPNGGPTAQSYVLLANLLEITVKSSGALHNEVQALWQSLATGPHPGNVRLILDFIMSLCLERREQNFVEYAKQIVVFLSSTNATPGIKVVEFLLLQITPKAMAPNEKRDVLPPPPDIALLPYCAELGELLPIGTKQAGFSLGQLSLILLVDLMVSPVLLTRDNLPVLLQVVTVLWDHYTPLVQEQAREMLVHLIHEIVISRLDDETPMKKKQEMEDLIDHIRSHNRTVVWSYEDSNGKTDGQDYKVPPSMVHLTSEIVKTFEITFPGIKELWAKLSLTWATSCPVRHLACRSFQIFRCILSSLDHVMLGDMLARLSNTVADEDIEIQTFSMEILTTLKTLIVELDSERLLGFPQLFWTICACLESINEREFLEAMDMLHEFLNKVDLRLPQVRRMLSDGQPSMWDGPFDGIQPLLYKGLRSSLCWEKTLKIMDKLMRLPSDSLVGDDNRLFFTLLANFPHFLNEFDRPGFGEETIHTAENLASICEARGLTSVALVLDQYASETYRNSKDFLNRLFGALRDSFLPQLGFKMVTFCMGLLTNGLSWVKIQTMRILCVAIPAVDMKNPEFACHGSDLISPLLRLLQTEFCMEAIEVLDNLKTLSGSSMDEKNHLRMSLTRPTSKAIRKEYERTQSLFGIPEASGWAIPMPAERADSTRMNIHAAFHMCQRAEGVAIDTTPTPEFEFHTEELPYGYLEAPERTETMMSDEARSTSNVGDLVTKLDSLDDFFDDATEGQFTDDDGRSSRTVTEYSPEAFDSGAQLYDEQILPILHQASNNNSFQNGFADRPPGAPSRDTASTNTMNPVTFSTLAPPRPGLQLRSMTMPSGATTSPAGPPLDVVSDDEFNEDILSDGDDERPRTSSGTQGSSFIENMIRPLAQSTRLGMRRLTGGRSRDGDRQRLPPPQIIHRVPVPTLPPVYATKPPGGGQGDKG